MESLHIEAQWNQVDQRMAVTLRLRDQTFMETFSAPQWQDFIARLNVEPLRLGGVTMVFKGDTSRARATRRTIRAYLRRVDAAWRASGSAQHI